MNNQFGNKGAGNGSTSLGSDINKILGKTSTLAKQEAFNQQEFDLFRQFLEDACGIALGDNKQYLVSNRIRRLLEEHQLNSFSELVRALNDVSNKKLRDQVIDVMTTNETFWFRDVYPYEHLKNKLLPELLNINNRLLGPIRIWSAACSTGQEPYSISMVVEEYKRTNMNNLLRPVQIIATDLANTVLAHAREGVYDRLAILRGLSSERLERFFDKESDNQWRIKSVVKERVEFRPFNLMDSFASLGKYDIIFCRNVLIYFNGDLKRQILQKLHASLKPGGILFLGSSEGLAAASDLFEMVRCDPGIFYKAI